MKFMIRNSLVSMTIVWLLACTLVAQQGATPQSASVPRLVNYSGKVADAQGKAFSPVLGVTFAIYQDQYGATPLWMETQNVHVDAKGNYAVQLGANSSNGLPLDLFASGEARWLGVRVDGAEEQPRVLLVSVPYALKAADAQTLSGLPASAFALAGSAGSNAQTTQPKTAAVTASAPNIGGSGTQDYIPLWTDSSGDLGNSILYQTGSGSSAKVGINEKNPILTLDVNGSELIRGLFEMATTNYANKSKGFNSNPINLESSAFNSGTGTYDLDHFQWQAEPVGNNTTSPGATLNLLYGVDLATPSETGLNVASNGQITFASGQTFPGAGTVTSVGFSAPSSDFTVSGSPVTKSGTLAMNWSVPPTSADTANAIVKRDANQSFSSGSINAFATSGAAITATDTTTGGADGVAATSANGVGVYTSGVVGVSATGATTGVQSYGGNTGVLGNGNEYGVFGDGVQNGVYGEASGGPGVTGSAATYGVFGTAQTYGVYGTAETGVYGTGTTYGVYGTGPDGVYGIGTEAGVYGTGPYGVYGAGTSGVYGTGTTGNAVTAYNTANGYGIYSYSSGYTAYLDGPKGHCHVDGSGNLACTGSKSAVVPVDDGTRHVALYAVESPENWFEDFGSARLSNGKAVISLDPTFTQTVNTELDYHVFLTPRGECEGLYVTDVNPTGFTVRELHHGLSNMSFDYRIVARRKGYEDIRLADMTKEFEVNKPQPLVQPIVPHIPVQNERKWLPAKPMSGALSTHVRK